MLSNQTSNIPPGRHQRQYSTPTVLSTSKNLPPVTQQRHEPHRRGLSLDQPTLIQQHNGPPQQENDVPSDEYILRQRLTESIMREAQQQQQSTARPGPEPTKEEIAEQRENSFSLSRYKFSSSQELGAGTAQHKYLSNPTPTWNDDMSNPLQSMYNTNITDMFPPFDSTTSAGYLDGFGSELEEYFRNIQHNETMNTKLMPHGLPSASVLQRTTVNEGNKQPCTPKSQIRTYYPMTPLTTPISENVVTENLQKTCRAGSSPTRKDPNLTIKPSHTTMQRGSSCQDNFAAMRQQAGSPDIPSPPHTAPLKPRGSVDFAEFPQPGFLSMSSLKMDIPTGDSGYNASNCSPLSNAVSSAISSFESSPEMTHMSLFGGVDSETDGSLMTTKPSILPSPHSAVDLGSQPLPLKNDQHASSQSMSEMDLEEFIEDTGVTCDEIASFICGPDPVDGKWMCLYPDCRKKFGRKENIKAHVQTHLDDRQFRCRDCNKRFVRQHDLKRHANIHSGVRSYQCPCGKPFARHDALTRHRQRGMCVGAFEGTPKKVIKRGRPKKTRPETDERLEKSAKTRQRALEKRCHGQYASSMSGSSVSSYPSPPLMNDDLEFALSSPSPARGSLQQIPCSFNEEFLSYTPPTSPSHSTGNCFSSQHSQHSCSPKVLSMGPSPKMIGNPEEVPERPRSQSGSRNSPSSQYDTLPDLDLSSSSPAPSKFVDFENSSEAATSESMPFNSNSDFFTKDFDLSAALNKQELTIGPASVFNDFFDEELEMTGFNGTRGKFDDAFGSLNSGNPWADDFTS